MFVHEAKRWLLAQRTVSECPRNRRPVVMRYMTAAQCRLRLAPTMDLATPPITAAVLLRDGITLLCRAAVAASDSSADEKVLRDLDPIRALEQLRASSPRSSDDDTRRVEVALSSRDPFYFDSMEPAELALVYDSLMREATWLRTRIDLRSPAYLAGTRFGRMAGLGLILLYVAYGSVARLCRPNLARGKPVRMSSQQPGTPDPSGLVDGEKGGKVLGAHTQVSGQSAPWVLIDLGRDYDIHEVVVYNRGDSNLNDGLPYTVELSADQVNFHEVGRRSTQFGDGSFLSPPWSLPVHDRGRFVRIRANWYIALSEIEVF